MSVLATILFLLVIFLGVASLVFGMPGTIVILIAAIVWGWASGFEEITGGMLFCLALLTVLGEVSDYFFGIVGARRFGSSRRGIVCSLIGGFLGALTGAPLLFGLGAVLGAFAGAFLGAVVVELFTYGFSQWRKAVRSGWGNFLGRVAGMMTKMAIAVGMAVWIAVRVI